MVASNSSFGIVNRQKLLRDQVYEILREKLLDGMGEGYRLIEEELAEQMNVSRTPVRDALRRLEIEGLITSSDSRGYEAAYSHYEDVTGALEIRLLLETYAVKEAAKHITQEEIDLLQELCQAEKEALQKIDKEGQSKLFEINQQIHKRIVLAARNKTLVNLLPGVSNHSSYRLYVMGDVESTIYFSESHCRLVDALKARDEDAAAAEIAYHIDLMRKIMCSESPDRSQED